MMKKKTKKRRRRVEGDCLRQCVARVIGREPRRVPHFVGKYRGRWLFFLDKYLRRIGYRMVMAGTSTKRPATVGTGVNKWIEIGTTKHGSRHAIVVKARKGKPVAQYHGGNPLKKWDSILVIWKHAA